MPTREPEKVASWIWTLYIILFLLVTIVVLSNAGHFDDKMVTVEPRVQPQAVYSKPEIRIFADFKLKADHTSEMYIFPALSQVKIEWQPSEEDLFAEWHYGSKTKLTGGVYSFEAVLKRGVKFRAGKDLKVTITVIE